MTEEINRKIVGVPENEQIVAQPKIFASNQDPINPDPQSIKETGRLVGTKAAAPISTDLNFFLANHQARLDDRNFLKYGVPPTGLVSQSYDDKAPDFQTAVDLVRGIVKEHPAFELKYSSRDILSSNYSGPIAILVSNIHFDPNCKKEEIDLLLDLYRNPELSLGDGLSESPTRNPIYHESIEDLFKYYKTDDILKTILHNQGRAVEFYAAESPVLRSIGNITNMSLSISSRDPEKFYNDRWSRSDTAFLICDGNLGDEKQTMNFMYNITKFLAQDWNLSEKAIAYYDSRLTLPDYGLVSHAMPFINFCLFPSFMENLNLYAICRMVFHRDDVIAEQFRKFQSGIHLMSIGTLHLPTLTRRLEEKKMPVIVISRRYDNELDILTMDNYARTQEYENLIEQRYEELRSQVAQEYEKAYRFWYGE